MPATVTAAEFDRTNRPENPEPERQCRKDQQSSYQDCHKELDNDDHSPPPPGLSIVLRVYRNAIDKILARRVQFPSCVLSALGMHCRIDPRPTLPQSFDDSNNYTGRACRGGAGILRQYRPVARD